MWRKRRSKRNRFSFFKKIFFVLLAPFIFVLLFFLVFRIGLFNIKAIEIENEEIGCVDNNQLKITSNLLGQNFFTLDQKKLNQGLKEKFVCVKEVNLSRSFPDKVSLKVKGRQAAAALISLKDRVASVSSLMYEIATPGAESMSANYAVDNEGVVFSKNTVSQNVPRVFMYNLNLSLGEKLKSNLIINVLEILGKVKLFGIVVKESWINGDIFIVTAEPPNPKIIFRLDEKIDIQLGSLQLILDKAKIDSSELKFVDLRFDKPVVRFAPKK